VIAFNFQFLHPMTACKHEIGAVPNFLPPVHHAGSHAAPSDLLLPPSRSFRSPLIVSNLRPLHRLTARRHELGAVQSFPSFVARREPHGAF
jgi:hypothetical protein